MIEFEEDTRNVYADLGYKNANEMLRKAQLATKIGEIIELQQWTEQEAANRLGLMKAELSLMLCGQFRNISETKMLDCLARLGRDVQIIIGSAQQRSATGHVTLVFAA